MDKKELEQWQGFWTEQARIRSVKGIKVEIVRCDDLALFFMLHEANPEATARVSVNTYINYIKRPGQPNIEAIRPIRKWHPTTMEWSAAMRRTPAQGRAMGRVLEAADKLTDYMDRYLKEHP